VDLGGSDHWLFLSDTAAMLRDLAIWRSGDLREIRIDPPLVQYSLVLVAKSVVLKTGVAF
jgi:hypothetical protein